MRPFQHPLLRHSLVPLALTASFVGLSLGGVEAAYTPAAILALTAIFALFSLALHAFLLLGHRLGALGGYLAAVVAALPLVWHARELTYRPSSLLAVPLVALLVAVPLHLAVRRLAPPSWRTLLAVLALSGLAGALAVGVAFAGSELLRWHLLRHNKLLGTPAYYLLADGVRDLEQEIFAAAPRAPGDGHPDPPRMPSEDLEAPDLETPETPAAPHLIYLVLDTLRADALELGGGRRELMPRTNAFLDGAWRFTDVVANASWTRPSMASFLTGLLPEEHGARDVDEPLEEGFVTLAETLGGLGWETAAFVTNVGAAGRSAGFAQGFETFYEFDAEPYARAARVRATVERWLDRRAEAAGEAAAGASRPLFLYLHLLDPHDPYLAGRVPRAKSFAEYTAAYDAELAVLDAELARLLELLERRLPGRRAVFLASDHGEEFGEHEEFGHGYSLYSEVIQVPVAFHTGGAPSAIGEPSGGALPTPLEGRDFYDLLVEWGAAESRGLPFDVAAWAASRRRAARYASLYYSSEGRLMLRPYLRRVCIRMVERDGYRLLWSAYGDTWELYDLERDPGERRNLAAERPEVVARLAPLLETAAASWHFPSPYEPSPEELEQLRALGYLDR